MKSFAVYLIESLDRVRTALTRGDRTIDTDQVFSDTDNPPRNRRGHFVDQYVVADDPETRVVTLALNKGLVATQPYLVASSVEDLLQKPVHMWGLQRVDDLPKIAFHHGRYYVVDGHHRLAAALLKGITSLQVALLTVR